MKNIVYAAFVVAAMSLAACDNDEPDKVEVTVQNPQPDKKEKDGFELNYKNEDGSISISDKQ